MHETIVIGAGLAGLSFARRWAEASGRSALLLDKSRGVGGRCATRRVEGQPVDHGLSFVHGSHPDFLTACRSVENVIEGWPRVVSGEGRACHPSAFRAGETRFAFLDGLSRLPKSLASGLTLRLETRVASLRLGADHIDVGIEDGTTLAAREVVVATPLEQARALLATLGEESDAAKLTPITRLLTMLRSEPCLTVIAGYGPEAAPPDWDMLYPNDAGALALVSHDSSKRQEKRFHVLVFQASAPFSRRYLEADPTAWSERLLEEATTHLGDWCRQPLWMQAHRWRFARLDAAACLSQPIRVSFPGGPRVGLAGEALHEGGGAEAAFLSGRTLAGRMSREDVS